MSGSSEEEVEIIPMPKHRVRFSDMPVPLQECAVRIVNKAAENHKLDKELASEIQRQINASAELGDETAGWHVSAGKSFASAITYQTKWVLFFDLLAEKHKTFLMFKTN